MRILVCGGAGYIGSNMTAMLAAAGHEPVVFDNLSKGHLAAVKGSRDERIRKCIAHARALNPNIQVEIEAASLDEVKTAVEAGADVIMLNSMSTADLKHAVKLASGKAVIAASGGVTLETAAEVAATGVDYITVGALSTTARRVRMRLELAS